MLSSALADNDNGVDQAEFDDFLHPWQAKVLVAAAAVAQEISEKDETATAQQLKSLQDFYKKHGVAWSAA